MISFSTTESYFRSPQNVQFLLLPKWRAGSNLTLQIPKRTPTPAKTWLDKIPINISLLIAIHFFFLEGTLDENVNFEQKLHKKMFNSSYYSVDLLPRKNSSQAINVWFGFQLIKIVEVVSVIRFQICEIFIFGVPGHPIISADNPTSSEDVRFPKIKRTFPNVSEHIPEYTSQASFLKISIILGIS